MARARHAGAEQALTDLASIRQSLDSGESTVAEIVESCLSRIRNGNRFWHALLPVDEEALRQEAAFTDRRRASGERRGALDGLPIVLKDLIEIEGAVSTNGSLTRAGRLSSRTAAVVERLRAAGAIIVGKAHMVEFAYGGWGTNRGMGAPRNPCDPRVHRSPGGSSSGSGVAVASGMVPASLGSDTGGSIRIPAALQGLTGFKPTVGLISLFGCLPLSANFDSIGPIAGSVNDCAWIAAALVGHDPRDPLSRPMLESQDLVRALDECADLRGRRVIVSPEVAWPVAVQPAVGRGLNDVVEALAALGVTIDRRDPPFDWHELLQHNGRAIGFEVWQTHGCAALDESLPIDPGVRLRMLRAQTISRAHYREAMDHAARTAERWAEWMRGADAWLMPGSPISAPPIDQVDEADPILSTFTRVANHLGGCALSLPSGIDAQGLPVGVQLVAPAGGDVELIRLGAALQRVTDWHRLKPAQLPSRDRAGQEMR
jgi:aspartyl-tRNA(Asn)/glutamyl-tRNA(Gln) amidotransferase subunit A